MSEQITVTPTRPYLARAIYEWICDNQLTPYLLVDATQPHTDVPLQFSARFSGASKDIYVPLRAVLGIYARENGQGLFFDPSEYADIQAESAPILDDNQQNSKPSKKKPSLRILD